jgi:tetratricopeptide (TPR) repeat protein
MQNSEGVQLYQQAYYEGALLRFQQAVQSDPTNPDGYYNLGATYHKLAELHNRPADYLQAENYYHQCLDKSKFNHADCYRGLAVLLVERSRSSEAFQLLGEWATRNPGQPDAQIELARLYEETGDRDQAKEHLIEAVTVDPSNARALAVLGRLREQTGDPSQALANYERSLQLNPNQPQIAARVASLRGPNMAPPGVILPGTFPQNGPTPPGGTRTVSAPGLPVR